MQRFRANWVSPASVQAEEVEKRWMEPLLVHNIQSGDEPEVVAVLRSHPLVKALASTDGKSIWIRHGNVLQKAGSEAELSIYRQWIDQAISSGGYVWHPTSGENPNHAREAVGLFRQDPWISIRIWRVGSSEVEDHIRQCVGGQGLIRVGLRKSNQSEVPAPEHPLPSWGEPPNLQVNLYRDRKSFLEGLITSAAFGRDWTWVCMESEKDELALRQYIEIWRTEAQVAIFLLLAMLWTGLFIWRRQRLGEVMDRDRLASMAHSLKTPLGLVKLRCDTLLRKTPPDPTETVIGLLRVSEDVDHLTMFIDDCLRGLSKSKASNSKVSIPPEWFRQVANDLIPAFKVEDRELKLELTPSAALANDTLLRTSLITLLENALQYGVGTVALRTMRSRLSLQVEVQNDGIGLNASQLSHLAIPFMRFRQQGQEGFAQEGRGLGLFLLSQVAAQEGWALTFSSAPGRGFTATLGLPLLPTARMWDPTQGRP